MKKMFRNQKGMRITRFLKRTGNARDLYTVEVVDDYVSQGELIARIRLSYPAQMEKPTLKFWIKSKKLILPVTGAIEIPYFIGCEEHEGIRTVEFEHKFNVSQTGELFYYYIVLKQGAKRARSNFSTYYSGNKTDFTLKVVTSLYWPHIATALGIIIPLITAIYIT